jgi:hypothetical protein
VRNQSRACAITTARKRIKDTYTDEDNKKQTEQGIHDVAEKIGAEVEKVSPKARSGQTTTPEERDTAIDEIVAAAVQEAGKDGAPETSAGAIKERLSSLPFAIVDTQWPGKEFIEIEHLGANTIVKLNKRHPFFTRIYAPILKAAGVQMGGSGEREVKDVKLTEEELQEVARSVQIGLDLLIMAYAKAESMNPDPDERYGDLRTQWGMFLYNMIQRIDGVTD